jgi:hypothetical protein
VYVSKQGTSHLYPPLLNCAHQALVTKHHGMMPCSAHNCEQTGWYTHAGIHMLVYACHDVSMPASAPHWVAPPCSQHTTF